MHVCGSASTWSKVALVLIVIALALHTAGLATFYWMQQETIQEDVVFALGLWKAYNCSGGHDSACNDLDIPDSYKSGSYTCVQAFECIVLVIVVVIAIVLALYVASERFREISVATFFIIGCFFNVALGIIAMIVWLAQIPSDHYPGYSFGLAVVAYILMFLAGILMIPDIRRYQKNRGDTKRVRPERRSSAVAVPSKYTEYRRHDYSYNRKFASPTPETNIRHYHNPNLVPYTGVGPFSPPPRYQTLGSGPTYGRKLRSDIQTPDIHLARHPRRY